MAKLDDYRRCVQQVLERYSQRQPAYGDLERQLLFDPVRDRYLLATVGWHQRQRVYGCLLHVDIRDGQIWIQHDGTEEGLAPELVTLGIPKEDIVLAFHAPSKRHLTGFGVGRDSTGQQAA